MQKILLKAQQLLPMGVLGRQHGLSSALFVTASPIFNLASLVRGSKYSLWNKRARWRCLRLAMHLVKFEEPQWHLYKWAPAEIAEGLLLGSDGKMMAQPGYAEQSASPENPQSPSKTWKIRQRDHEIVGHSGISARMADQALPLIADCSSAVRYTNPLSDYSRWLETRTQSEFASKYNWATAASYKIPLSQRLAYSQLLISPEELHDRALLSMPSDRSAVCFLEAVSLMAWHLPLTTASPALQLPLEGLPLPEGHGQNLCQSFCCLWHHQSTLESKQLEISYALCVSTYC